MNSNHDHVLDYDYEFLLVELDRSSGVLTVTLDRPEVRNALNGELVDELCDAIGWSDADERVRVVLLRGAGKDFCAGADLQALLELGEAGVSEQMEDADAIRDLFLIVRRVGLPVIAAVHGNALAGGCGLATACDVVLASDEARFGYPEVNIGFVPAMVMTMLRRAVGEKRAFDLIATGRKIDAEEAANYGLVQHVYPKKEFDDRVDQYAAKLAEKSATALALSKRLLYRTELHSFEASIRAGAELNVLARMTDDYRAGIEQFLSSRRKENAD